MDWKCKQMGWNFLLKQGEYENIYQQSNNLSYQKLHHVLKSVQTHTNRNKLSSWRKNFFSPLCTRTWWKNLPLRSFSVNTYCLVSCVLLWGFQANMSLTKANKRNIIKTAFAQHMKVKIKTKRTDDKIRHLLK